MKLRHEFDSNSDFREYLYDNNLKLDEYFLKAYDKRDLLTGEKLIFRNEENYLTLDFKNKQNLGNWVINNGRDSIEYLTRKLKERAESKGLVYYPSQMEMRDFKELPSISVLKRAGIRLYDLKVDLKKKYDYSSRLLDYIAGVIFVDTREQKPLDFKNGIVEKLAYGDYASPDNPHIFIERKSISDLWGTMSKRYDKFKEEIIRAREDGVYLIVMIETHFYIAQSYNHRMKFSKATAPFVFKRMRDLVQEFDNIQFLFSKSRDWSKRHISKILAQDVELIKKCDLQYMLDERML